MRRHRIQTPHPKLQNHHPNPKYNRQQQPNNQPTPQHNRHNPPQLSHNNHKSVKKTLSISSRQSPLLLCGRYRGIIFTFWWRMRICRRIIIWFSGRMMGDRWWMEGMKEAMTSHSKEEVRWFRISDCSCFNIIFFLLFFVCLLNSTYWLAE